MAFKAANGWNNLPNGVFSPTIFSQEVQLAFRKSTTVGSVTNNKYFGEISGFGDTVEIMKEPTIEITDYARGADVEPQNLIDESFQLQITEAKKFAFTLDDIEEKHSHVDFMSLASDQAGYKLRDTYDIDVLAYMSGYKYNPATGVWSARVAADMPGTKAIDTADADELLATMKLRKGSFTSITTSSAGDHSIPVGPYLAGATALPTAYVTPTMLVNRMHRLLDQQLVPKEGRFLIIDPVLLEVLSYEGSPFLNQDWGAAGALRNGLVLPRWMGFRVYVSNNLPSVGTGPGTSGTANQNDNFGIVIAGHEGAVATAEQIKKVEKFRSHSHFGDVVRGLHVYGRKILRPEAIVVAKYNLAF